MQAKSGGFDEDDEDQRLFAFQTLLDGSQYASEPTVDLDILRRLCSRGIPDHPPHLRPLAYALLLETLPSEKREWRSTLAAQREKYYNLVRTFMDELESQPSTSKFTHDDLLSQLSKDVKPLKAPFWRSRTTPKRSSPFRPLSATESRSATSSTRSGAGHLEDDTGSDSGLDDGIDHSIGLNGVKRPARITNRRATFKRMDLLAQVEHRGGFAPPPQASAAGSTGANGNAKHDGPVGEGSDTQDQEPEEIMSPKITLSVDPGPAAVLPRLEAVRPPPLNTSSLLPSPSTANTIAINGNPDSTSPDAHKPPSPITLLSPKPLPSGSGSPSPYSGAMYHPDTHLESLIRMLYIFVRTNHQWKYQTCFVDIASNLYLIHSGGRVSLDHAEERTFWALSAFLSEIDQALCLTSEGDSRLGPDGLGALDKLNLRLRWANPPFADILQSRNIEPTLYAYRWFNHLFIRDLPLAIVPTLYDFIISESPSTAASQPKSDLIIDIAVAMVLSLKDRLLTSPAQSQQPYQQAKTRGLWGFSESEAQIEDDNEVFLRNIELLRNYPLRSVGGIRALLESAARFRQARIQATKQGDDPDKTARPPNNNNKRVPSKSSPTANRSVSGSTSTSTLTSSYTWSRATSFFSSFSASASGPASSSTSHTVPSAAIAEPQTQSQPGPRAPTTPGREASASRNDAQTPTANGNGNGNGNGDGNGTGHTFSPPSSYVNPISPLSKKDFAPHAHSRAGSHPTSSGSTAHNRERSDSVASSVSSITERLASLTQSTPPAKSQIGNSGASSPLPRPLLLSGSARRASSSSTVNNAFTSASARIAMQRRDSSPLPSPRGSPPLSSHSGGGSAILSPPASIRSPPSGGNIDGNGLYRIGSRNVSASVSGNRQRSRSSLGENESPISRLSLGTPVTIARTAHANEVGDDDKDRVGRDLDYGASASTPTTRSVGMSNQDGDGEPTPIAVAAPVNGPRSN